MSTPAKLRRTKAEQREGTLAQILDAAEYLFGLRGLYGVTLKEIAAQADVHTSHLHYYFEDKRAIFDAVFARRAGVTADRRSAALDQYMAAHPKAPTVEGILRAYIDTDLDLYITGGEGWRNYAALGAQVAMTPKWGAKLFDTHFDPVVLKLIDLLGRALPDCPREDIFWGYHFVAGALVQALARTGRIDVLSDGMCRSDDFDAIKARMARFLAFGFEGICRDRADARAG
jgi:AcrR family transcriptional regulator